MNNMNQTVFISTAEIGSKVFKNMVLLVEAIEVFCQILLRLQLEKNVFKKHVLL